MKKTRNEKGITLIALLITIVVLLILAAVAINSIQNDGILSYAQNAAISFNQAVADEQDMLNEYINFLNNNGSESSDENENEFEGTIKTVATIKNTVLSEISNTDVYDEYGNKIVVPAGFKIRVDDTTNNADTVIEGIVIEHGTDGNQFVWIPVGKIYTDTEKTEVNAKMITLGRYDFDSITGEHSEYSGSYTEDTAASHNSSYGNTIARDIETFIKSATTKNGYYLGRYEARKNSEGDLTTVSTDTIWNNVNQITASSESQSMYGDGYSSGTFSSDLVNGYAWDTAIVFLQFFDNRADKTTPYSMQNSLNTSLATTGSTTDVICNIYDMASNCFEWSTETYSNTEYPYVWRGGHWDYSRDYTNTRGNGDSTNNLDGASYRPILYVGL